MQRVLGFVVLGLMVAFASGCGVSKEKYMKLEDEKQNLEQAVHRLSGQVGQLERERDELSYANQGLQKELHRLHQERSAFEERKRSGKLAPEEESIEESALK